MTNNIKVRGIHQEMYAFDITKEEVEKYGLTVVPYFFAEKEAISQGIDYVYVGFRRIEK